MSNLKKSWLVAFYLYGILSLSSMAGMGLGAAILFALFLLNFYLTSAQEKKHFYSAYLLSPLGKISLLFFAAAIVSQIISGLWPPLGLKYDGNALVDLKKFHYFLFPFILAYTFTFFETNVSRSKFWNFWFGIALISALLAFIQHWGGFLFPSEWMQSRFFRPISETGYYHGQGLMFFHLSFASSMSFAAIAAWSKVIWTPSRKGLLLWITLALLFSLAVFVSYSRISWVALPIGVCTLLFLRKPKLGAIGLVASVMLIIAVWNLNGDVRKRFIDNKAGVNERLIVWLASWEMVKNRPLTGVGFARTGFYSEPYGTIVAAAKPEFSSHAHNNLIDIIAAMGAMGFIVYLLWWEIVFVSAWKSLKKFGEEEKWVPAAAIAGFVSFHINGFTQVNFWDGKSMHTMMLWVAIVLACSLENSSDLT